MISPSKRSLPSRMISWCQPWQPYLNAYVYICVYITKKDSRRRVVPHQSVLNNMAIRPPMSIFIPHSGHCWSKPGFARTSCSHITNNHASSSRDITWFWFRKIKAPFCFFYQVELSSTWTDLFCRLVCRSSRAWIPLVSMSVRDAAATKKET